MDSRGARSWGGVWLSARTRTTDTQPRHVDRHRTRTRAHNHAPTNTHNQTRAHKTWTPARNSHAKPWTHKGAGRWASLDPNPQRPTNVSCTCPHKDPRGAGPRPRPEPLSPGSPLPKVRAPHSGPTRGVQGPLPMPRVQEKLKGPVPAPVSSAARRPDRGAWLGLGASDLRSQRGLLLRPGTHTHLEACAAAASARSPRRPGCGPSGRRFSQYRATRPLVPARRRANPPPARRPVAASPAARRLRECRQSVCFSWRSPRPLPARRARAEPGSTLGSVSKVRVQLSPTRRARSQLPAIRIPAPSLERLSNLSRWLHGREHLEVAGV